MLQLNSQDAEIIKQAVESRFWKMIEAYLQERKEVLSAGVLSSINEEMSKIKYNDRDLLLAEVQLIGEVLDVPNNLLTLIGNQAEEEEVE